MTMHSLHEPILQPLPGTSGHEHFLKQLRIRSNTSVSVKPPEQGKSPIYSRFLFRYTCMYIHEMYYPGVAYQAGPSLMQCRKLGGGGGGRGGGE